MGLRGAFFSSHRTTPPPRGWRTRVRDDGAVDRARVVHLLLEEVVRLGAVLFEPNGAELYLNALLGGPGGAVVLVKEHGAVKVSLRLLVLFLDLVALGTALQQLHLKVVVLLERARVRVEGVDDVEGSLRR